MFYFVIIFVGLFVFFLLFYRKNFEKIKKYTHKTTAKVIGVEENVRMEYDSDTGDKYKKRECWFRYEYIVDGNTYAGFGYTNGFVGKKVKIYYDEKSVSESITAESRNSYKQIILVLVIVVLAFLIAKFQ